MQAKIFECVAVATTLCNTLVELQLLYLGSMSAQGLGILGCIESLCRLLQFPHLPHGHTWFTFFQLNQTQSKVQLDHSVSNQEG